MIEYGDLGEHPELTLQLLEAEVEARADYAMVRRPVERDMGLTIDELFRMFQRRRGWLE